MSGAMTTGQGRSEEMTELLDLPLQEEGRSSFETSGSRDDAVDSEAVAAPSREDMMQRLALFAADIAASVVFWYGWYLLLASPMTDAQFYGILGLVVLVMIAYRVYRAYTSPDDCGIQIPYTCGYVPNNDKELFLVATIHISPRAPKDVEAVIDKTVPDIAMIELDDERLDRMRDVEVQEPKREELQAIHITEADGQSSTIYTQRALWNAEWSGEEVSGDIAFDEDNEYGLERSGDALRGKIALVRRGSPNGEFAPFALKAHTAAAAGAQAILVINRPGMLPMNRIGGGSLIGDLRVALSTCSCGFPPIPVLLLPAEDGERLAELCKARNALSAWMKVKDDEYPRRTLRRRLCQSCALVFSGIGILYGIIQCFDVEVGAEFTEAEVAATAQGIPCACIDVDMNRFWARLGWAAVPTPCNLASSLLSWLAFPRILARFLFPPRGNVDLVGCMFLHFASLSARTWIAFLLAGFVASSVATWTLQLFGGVSERGAEEAGVVSSEDRRAAQTWIMLLLEAYLLPQVCQAVAASRDEAMYRSIVAKGRELNARRLVAVVGAGHANGILHYARTQGL
mmetsp:Transcript_97651/g.291637  ORF Transcript_97651/g.291637 Transcript_97651/m.291637 type:complete len:571 (-) Transcript_97651:90-1802(-)